MSEHDKEYETDCACGDTVDVVFRRDFDGDYNYFIAYHYALDPKYSVLGTCSESDNYASGIREKKSEKDE